MCLSLKSVSKWPGDLENCMRELSLKVKSWLHVAMTAVILVALLYATWVVLSYKDPVVKWEHSITLP